jgi:hypothetical protein
MINRKFILVVTLLAGLCGGYCGPVLAAVQKAPTVEGFDFNYTAETDARFPLVQVFDDGDRTYFQFTELEKYPQVTMELDSGKRVIVPLEAKTPYLIVKGVGNKFFLTSGKASIVVSYNGKRVVEAKPAPTTMAASPAAAEQAKQDPVAKAEKPVRVAKQKKTVDYSENANDGEHEQEQESEPRLVEGIKINVPFFENSVTVSKKAREDLETKISQLRKTHRAIVRGRPSADGDTNTARTRSFAIKGILLSAGMDEDQIEVKPEDVAKTGKNEGFYLSEILLIEASLPSLAKGRQSTSKNGGWSNAGLKEAPVTKAWKLTEGKTIGKEIGAWATDAGWKLVWNLNKDWQVPASTTFTGDFKSAASEVIKTLAANGVLIRAQFFDGNKTVVVSGPGVAEQ